MAKRFTGTEKWSDPWFSNLSQSYKLLWLYLLDNCDHAGIWRVNKKLADFQVGDGIDWGNLKEVFNGRLVIVDDEKWFIPKFITYQYPRGLPKNWKVSKSVREILLKNNCTDTVLKEYGGSTGVGVGVGVGKGNKDVSVCLKYFGEIHEKTRKEKYVANFGKDGKIFKELLAILETNEIKRRIDLFFKSDDEFIQKAGYTVGVFKSQINKFGKDKDVKLPSCVEQ